MDIATVQLPYLKLNLTVVGEEMKGRLCEIRLKIKYLSAIKIN